MTSTPYEIHGILVDGTWLMARSSSRYRCLLAVRRFRSYEIICGGRVVDRRITDQAEWDRYLERQLANHKQRRASKHGARRSG